MNLNKNLLLDAVSLSEAAAIAAFDWIGKGNEKMADQASVHAMRSRFEKLNFHSRIVIGEGERDEAPMLYIGEEMGDENSNIKIDIAVDPLEGTTLCAHNIANSISVLALAPRGSILHAPDVYMDKIAIGDNLPKDLVDLDEPVAKNLKNLAHAKGCMVSDLMVCVLNRPRHKDLIAQIRDSGAKIQLISDGDVTASIATLMPSCNIDMYIGIGGAPEGVLASAALKSMGGFFQGRLLFENDMQKARAKSFGVIDPDAKLSVEDMIKADVIFAATGVTNGWFLNGVQKNSQKITTHSFVTQYSSGKQMFINAGQML